MNQRLLLAWQNPSSRCWLVVGLLEKKNNAYSFKYSQSAKEAEKKGEFIPFGVMTDLHKTYSTPNLFPLFKNRLLAKSRPEYADYLSWLGLETETTTDMDELARSGGIRATDQLQLFPYPENKKGEYQIGFFVHGLRHMPKEALQRIMTLKAGDDLAFMPDPQNKHDSMALAIRTEDPPVIIGYCPRYFTEDFINLLQEPKSVQLSVAQLNLNAPLQYRLRCNLKASWRDNFAIFADREFNVKRPEMFAVAVAL